MASECLRIMDEENMIGSWVKKINMKREMNETFNHFIHLTEKAQKYP